MIDLQKSRNMRPAGEKWNDTETGEATNADVSPKRASMDWTFRFRAPGRARPPRRETRLLRERPRRRSCGKTSGT